MRLAQLKKTWSYLSQEEKEELVATTNERRLEAFEIVKNKRNKKSTKKTSKRKKSTSVKQKHKTPEGLMALMEKMSPEEKKNFQLMLQTKAHG